MGTEGMCHTEESWEVGSWAVYEVVVEGVARAFVFARPQEGFVGVGPKQVGATLYVVFRATIGEDGQVHLAILPSTSDPMLVGQRGSFLGA